MNKFQIVALILTIACVGPIAAPAAEKVTTRYKYASTSPLASGRWVKISVNGTGIYEISYARLQEMGFSDPTKVAVFGTGGALSNLNFLDTDDNRLIEDNVQPIAVVHANDKLMFYAYGDANVKATYHENSKETFIKRTDKNIYSSETSYLLTDSRPVHAAEKVASVDKENANDLETGLSYFYHESDLVQGIFGSGGIWYGESLHPANGKLILPFNAQYYTKGDGCRVWIDIAMGKNQGMNKLHIGINNNEVSKEASYGSAQIRSFYYHDTETELNCDYNNSASNHITIYCDKSTYPDLPLNLDYLTIAYPVSFQKAADDPDFSSVRATFHGKSEAAWRHPVPAGACVWDVTNPTNAKEVEIADGYIYSSGSDYKDIVAFNPTRTMLQINDGFEVVANTNLHALQKEPIDMLIFTVEKFRPYAERFAEMRKNTEGLNCLVVTNSEVYNEFNAGTPDPICYRTMAKMLYQGNNGQLKNILFFGPLTTNLRNCGLGLDTMIAYQDIYTSDLQGTIPYTGMDYYGIVDDNFDISKYGMSIRPATITLGVGVLGIQSYQQAEDLLKKYHEYYTKEDFSGLVNEMVNVSCPGDSHQHENQSINIGNYIQKNISNNLNSELINETIWTEPLSEKQRKQRITNALERGKNIFIYFGHGNLTGITTASTGLLSMNELRNIHNSEHGLAFIAACDISNCDRNKLGFGDYGVLSTHGGFIGMAAATHSVESRENYNLAEQFFKAMFFDASNKFRTKVPTIGEIYAQAKTGVINSSKIAYVYIGDPSTRIPIPLRKVKLSIPQSEYAGGETVEISGTVVDASDKMIEDYNGFVTLKLAEPARSIKTEGQTGNKMLDYTLNDLPMLAVKGEVKNGKFSVKFPLPESVGSFAAADKTTMLPIYAGTYDTATRVGGTGLDSLALARPGASIDPSAHRDTQQPTIHTELNAPLGVLKVSISDDTAILPGIGNGCGTIATIDGKDIRITSTESSGVAVTNFESAIDLEQFGSGRKIKFEATATDVAGNTATYTEEFELPAVTQLLLSADSELAVDLQSFTLKGETSAELNLIVKASDGTIITDMPVGGKTFEIDTTDIKPGTYRAAVRSNSALGSKIYSNWVTFTVID